ncbi:MAG: rod shape-determining protein MreD [Blautia sp.]
MKSKIILFFTIILCFLLQCTLLKYLSVAEITPNLLLILCVSMGLMRGKKSGLFVGFFSGFLIDLFYGSLLGFYALIYMYIGYLSGFFYKIYYDNTLKVPVLLVAGSDAIYSLAVYGLQFMLRGRMGFFYYVSRIMIPEILMTVVLTILIYRIFYQLNHRFMRVKRKERNSLWLVK